METGGLPVREERQSRDVSPHYAGAQRERLIHFVLFTYLFFLLLLFNQSDCCFVVV